MNKRNVRKLARMKRVRQFCADLLLEFPHPAVSAESTALGTCITELETAAVKQVRGAGSITSAVDHRLEIAKDLHQLMAGLAKAAKRLNRATYPEVAGKMRLRGATDSFPKLLTRALLFKETLTPIKAAFVALGAPADVDEELDGLITALQGAGTRKIASIDTKVGGTLSIEAKAREGIGHIQQLDAIFTQLFRKDLIMLAQWNVVKRATPYRNDAAPEELSQAQTAKVGVVFNHATGERSEAVGKSTVADIPRENACARIHVARLQPAPTLRKRIRSFTPAGSPF